MLRYVPLAVLVAAAVPATAQPTAPPPPQTANARAKPNPLDKVVCKTEEVIGSRLNSQRVCMTVREWQDQADDSRQALEKIQQGQGVVPSG